MCCGLEFGNSKKVTQAAFTKKLDKKPDSSKRGKMIQFLLFSLGQFLLLLPCHENSAVLQQQSAVKICEMCPWLPETFEYKLNFKA